MKIGCIILSNTKNLEMYGMCQRVIHSLVWSEPTIDFNIIVVESNKKIMDEGFVYDMIIPQIKTIIPDEEFGYNKFLNYGLDALKVDNNSFEWIIIANSDIIFTQKWLTKMLEWQSHNKDVLSMSPWEPNWHIKRNLDDKHGPYFGYRTSFEITGWCLVIHKDIIKKCNLFDESFKFWYQDNDYALTLEKYNIKHVLLPQSRVYHMLSKSHHLLTEENKHNMTDGQINILKKKWGNI